MAKVYDLDKQPTPQEAEYVVKRLSSTFNFLDNTNQPMTPLDDKSLKIATFSLQKYLKVKKKKKGCTLVKVILLLKFRKKILQPSFWKEEDLYLYVKSFKVRAATH